MNEPTRKANTGDSNDDESNANWWIVLSTPSENDYRSKAENHANKRDEPQGGFWARTKEVPLSDWIMVAATAVIAFYAYAQYTGSGRDTKQLIAAAQDQAESASDFAQSADDIDDTINAAQDSFGQMADNSSAAIKTTQESIRLDQRAWVVYRGISHQPATAPAIDQTWDILAYFGNTGKTPAVNVMLSCKVEPEKSEADVSFHEFPYGPRLLFAPNDFTNFCQLHPVPEGVKLRQLDVDTITSKAESIFVFGSVSYDDVFGKSHWMTFCRKMNADGKTWTPCESHPDRTGDGKYKQP